MKTGIFDCYPTGSPDPTCSTGSFYGYTCCAKSCGLCGGAGCTGRTGGAYACCHTFVPRTGRGCDKYPPPCILPKSLNHVPCALCPVPCFHSTQPPPHRPPLITMCTTLHPLDLAFKLKESDYPGLARVLLVPMHEAKRLPLFLLTLHRYLCFSCICHTKQSIASHRVTGPDM